MKKSLILFALLSAALSVKAQWSHYRVDKMITGASKSPRILDKYGKVQQVDFDINVDDKQITLSDSEHTTYNICRSVDTQWQGYLYTQVWYALTKSDEFCELTLTSAGTGTFLQVYYPDTQTFRIYKMQPAIKL